MAILGLNISGLHSSACLVENGAVLYAITEERISRIKNDKSFPHNAIKYCLEASNKKKEDITDIFIGWNPRHYINKSDNTMNEAMKNRGKMAYLALNELSTLFNTTQIEITQIIKAFDTAWNIHFLDHHEAHLSNVFYQSSFENSDFIVADGFGEVTTGMIGTKDYNSTNKLAEFNTPHSLGSFYSTFTDFLGFKPNSDEWKVMALASLGNSDKYYDKVKELISINDINFELDLSYFEHYLFFTKHYYSKKFIDLFGTPVKNNKFSQDHYDLVAAVQKVGEDVVIELLNNLHNKTNSENVVVSGGFFMNSVLNGKILEHTKYKNLYIGGSPDDSGISIGAALYGYNKIHNNKFSEQITSNYYGKTYSDEEIENVLIKRKIKYRVSTNIEQETASFVKDSKIIAWFQGGSEFGQRALGNRSIIADPTNPKVKDLVNSSIKYREGFRPFAPSILYEDQNDFFEFKEEQTSYFMERVFKFKEKYKDILPAVYHYDGTGRLQTVKKDINPKYHKLITEIKNITGYGVVLNTSFNVNGMPLVERPEDAVDCFYQSGLDVLVLNNFIIEK